MVSALLVAGIACSRAPAPQAGEATEGIPLPPPETEGSTSVERAIFSRVSRRSYGRGELSLNEIGQLLWAAAGLGVDGVTGASRVAPSAGATQPLAVYAVCGGVSDVAPGIYRYDPFGHALVRIWSGDVRAPLAVAALRQSSVAEAPAIIIIGADYARTTKRYGERGHRYVHVEAGHVAQNIYLQAEARGLGTVAIGAFDDEEVARVLGVKETPLLLMPVGKRE